MDATEIIRSFCGKIGIAYEPDKFGSCVFEADGLRVAITDVREIDSIGLVGDLGEPPPERLERLFRMIDSLYAEIERFVCTLETWTKVIGDYRGVLDSVGQVDDGGRAGLASPGLISV